MNLIKKLFVYAIVFATIVTMSLPAGIAVAATNVAAGDLIKANNSAAVYYYNGSERFAFPNPSVYFSWYQDFSTVKTITADELAAITYNGKLVTVRPGTKLVKIESDPKVYAIEPGGKLRSIPSEAVATTLYGNTWAKMVTDVSDAFWFWYDKTNTTPLSDKHATGSLVKYANSNNVYYIDGTTKRLVSAAGMTANKFDNDFVITIPDTITYTDGTQIAGAEEGLFPIASGTTTAPVATGNITVALSGDTPATATVPMGATNVVFTKFVVTAGGDADAKINYLTVTRYGMGVAGDFENVYLYDGATRLTSGRSINSSTNQATFTGLNLTIPKGTSKILTISGDIKAYSGTPGAGATSGNYNGLRIASASDINTSGAISGSFPISGNVMSVASLSNGTVTIAKNGTVADPKAGQTAVKVAGFNVTSGSAEDITLNTITLYQAGTISNTNLSNFTLKQTGTTIATASSINSRGYLVFSLATPYSIDKGITKAFEVYADVSATAKADETIKFYVDNNADVYAIGKTYGYGVAVTRTAYDNGDNNGADASWSTVKASQIAINYQGPAKTDYSVQSTDVELLRFTITAQSNVEFRRSVINLTAGGTVTAGSGLKNATPSANYTDVKLVDANTGAIIAGPQDVSSSGSDTTQDITYTDTWTLNAGQSRVVKVTADIANFTPAADETIKATLNAFGNTDIKNLDTNSYVTISGNVVPSGAITGNAHNVLSGSATLSLAGTPTANTIINGSSDVPMTGLNIKAGSGKDITVTSITLTAVGANSCAIGSDCIQQVKLYDGTTVIGTQSLATDNTITFDNLTLNIAKGITKTLVAKADLNTLSTVSTSPASTLHLDAASGAISAQDPNGNGVTISDTVTGPTQTLASTGSLTLVKAANETGVTDSRLVSAGVSGDTIARFRFTATNEPLRMKKLAVKIYALDAAGATTTAATEIAGVSLWSGSTKIHDYVTPSTVGTDAIAEFTMPEATNFDVPKDGSSELTIKVNYNTLSSGRSGQSLTAAIDYNSNFEFRGINTQTVVSSVGSADVVGNPVYIYKSVPTLANGTLPTTVLSSGNQIIGRFTVSANNTGVISWRKVVFTVSTSSATTSGYTLVDESNTSVATCTWAAGKVTCTNTTGDNQVAAGSTKTYTLKADVTITTDHGSVSTQIARPTTAFADIAAASGLISGTASFVWSDESITGHTFESADYLSDFLVKNLPLDSQTISR